MGFEKYASIWRVFQLGFPENSKIQEDVVSSSDVSLWFWTNRLRHQTVNSSPEGCTSEFTVIASGHAIAIWFLVRSSSYNFPTLCWKKRIYAHVQLRKILLTVDAGVILFVFNSIAREYSNFSHDILEVILLGLWFTLFSIEIELEGHCIPSMSLLLILTGTVSTLHAMPASEKEAKYDFGDPSRTDCEKWKLFSKELLHLLMNTHGTAWRSCRPMDYRRQRGFSWW